MSCDLWLLIVNSPLQSRSEHSVMVCKFERCIFCLCRVHLFRASRYPRF